MINLYKQALLLVQQKQYTGISMLILEMKPKGFDLDYTQALTLVNKMREDEVVKNSIINNQRIDKLLKSSQ